MARTTYASAEALRRRHVPDPLADVRADVVESLGRAETPGERQAIYDAAMLVASQLTDGGDDYDSFVTWAHVTFIDPDATSQLAEAHRDAALERVPELAEVFTALEAAGSDAEKAEIVTAAITSGFFDGDDDAMKALVLSDPNMDSRLDAEADQRAAEFTRPERRHARGMADITAASADLATAVAATPGGGLRARLDQFLSTPGDETAWLNTPEGTDG